MTIEILLARIASAGWRVNNLFQRADGRWQANLRRPGEDSKGAPFTDFAVADTAAAALQGCAEKMGLEAAARPFPASGQGQLL